MVQLTQANRKLAPVIRKVTVCEQLDGTIVILLGKRELPWEELPQRPATRRAVQPLEKGSGSRKSSGADHPFRRPFQTPQAPAQESVARIPQE